MADPIKEEFPSNSHLAKATGHADGSARKPLEPIVTSKVSKKRRSIGNSITQTLFGNDTKSVLSYVLNDVLIPAAKSTIQEMVSGGIEMLLFGDSVDRSRSYRRSGNRNIINYGSFSRQRDVRSDRTSSTKFRSLSRGKYEDVVIEDRGEAEDVIENLIELIEQYGVATLADFYELVGIDSDFSDNKYGWDNLARASVNRVREGYVIDFPKPRPLGN